MIKASISALLLAATTLLSVSASAKDAYLSTKEKNGQFTCIELSEGVKLSHNVEKSGNTTSCQTILTLPSARIIEKDVLAIDSFEVVTTPVAKLSFHFPAYPDAEQVFDKENYVEATLDIDGKETYADQSGLNVSVKGRGNSTWRMDKKPMRLKFKKKTALFDFKKAKSYVLLANYIDPTHIKNAVALWIGRKLALEYTNSCLPVDVFINDKFAGLFLLTEKIGINSGSVDIEEQNGMLFEVSEEFDEKYKFRSAAYNLPVMVKDPDFDELYEDNPTGMTPAQRLAAWQEDFTTAEAAIAKGKAAEYFDMESLAKYIIAQEMVANTDLYWPKSVYIYKEGINPATADQTEKALYKYKFGPLWDFDYTMDVSITNDFARPFTHEINYHRFFVNLKKDSEFKKYYKQYFATFYQEYLPELLNYIDDLSRIIDTSANLDALRWPSESSESWYYRYPSNNFKERIESLKTWLRQRAEYIKNRDFPN